MSLAIMAGAAGAEKVKYINPGEDNWTNGANWIYYKLKPVKRGVPTEVDDVRLCNGTVRITTAVTVSCFKVGAEGVGKVIIDGGTLVAVGTGDYNSSSYNTPGTIIVTNGGSATFYSRFMVGFEDYSGGRLEIYDGTVRVAAEYFHSKDYVGSAPVDTRTTIYQGGLLEVDTLTLNTGVMDIAGGKVIVRTGSLNQINQWIEEGGIVAMGDAEGWKINATVNPETGYITLVAEPTSEPKPPRKPRTPPVQTPPSVPAPLSVGMRSPVPPVSARFAV